MEIPSKKFYSDMSVTLNDDCHEILLPKCNENTLRNARPYGLKCNHRNHVRIKKLQISFTRKHNAFITMGNITRGEATTTFVYNTAATLQELRTEGIFLSMNHPPQLIARVGRETR
jgi:hypothetical protein